MKDMPAKKAGLQEWDVIVSLNGEMLTPESSLRKILQKYVAGDVVKLGIERDGEMLFLPVQLEELPES